MTEYKERLDFKAKYEPKGNYILHGSGQYDIYALYESFDNYRKVLLDTPPIITMTYTGLHSHIRYDFYINQLKSHLNSYGKNSFLIPQINLELCKDQYPGTSYVQDIALGAKDNELIALLTEIKSLNRPVFLIPGYGFNGEWNGYQDNWYILAFRYIKNMIDKLGCKNIALVWCYNPDAEDKEYMHFYPGDDYVDWWGIEIYNTPDVSKPYSQLFLDDAVKHNKPVFLSESTACKFGATLNGWKNWFTAYFEYIKNNPMIKASCYINWDWTKYARWHGWGNCRIEQNEDLVKLYRNEMKNKIWLNDNNPKRIKEKLWIF